MRMQVSFKGIKDGRMLIITSAPIMLDHDFVEKLTVTLNGEPIYVLPFNVWTEDEHVFYCNNPLHRPPMDDEDD